MDTPTAAILAYEKDSVVFCSGRFTNYRNPLLKLASILNTLIEQSDQDSLIEQSHQVTLKAKHFLFNTSTSECNKHTHLQNLSVQSKFGDSAQMERWRFCRAWHQLMSGFHPKQFSFSLQAS